MAVIKKKNFSFTLLPSDAAKVLKTGPALAQLHEQANKRKLVTERSQTGSFQNTER